MSQVGAWHPSLLVQVKNQTHSNKVEYVCDDDHVTKAKPLPSILLLHEPPVCVVTDAPKVRVISETATASDA